MTKFERQRLSFGAVAAHYDAVRPSYPADAIAWALGDRHRRVVDLGAGTGILTRVLLAAGHDTVPVEPDEEMRARLAAAMPGTTALAGSAESIPLPDASVDAVVAGQAYHWFDQARAHPEVARVLRPGGTFAAIWNTRDESVAWVAELTRVAHLLDGTGESQPNATSFGPLFGPIERRNFHQSVQHTGESLLALLHSRSYYLTGSPAEQAGIDARVRALVATHPQLAERERFELPYLTEVHRAIRRD